MEQRAPSIRRGVHLMGQQALPIRRRAHLMAQRVRSGQCIAVARTSEGHLYSLCNLHSKAGVETARKAAVEHERRTMKQAVNIVKLGTKRLSSEALVMRGRTHLRMITGNPTFASIQDLLPAFEEAVEELQIASSIYNFNKGRLDLVNRNAAYDRLKYSIRVLASAVQRCAGMDVTLILSAGFEVRGKRKPSQLMGAPTNVRAERTPEFGRIDLRWGAQKNRRIYKVYITEGDPTDASEWQLLTETGANYVHVTGLQRFKTYSFRIAAWGPAGLGPVSQAAIATAA